MDAKAEYVAKAVIPARYARKNIVISGPKGRSVPGLRITLHDASLSRAAHKLHKEIDLARHSGG